MPDSGKHSGSDHAAPLLPRHYDLPDDPLLGSQFNLNNTGQTGGTPGIDINVFPVWEDYRGDGVTVGVIDDGVEHTHPDLIANYNTTIDHDSRGGDSDAMAEGDDRHGTAVAGIIGADDNGLGSVGVAPDVELAGFRMGFGANGTLSQITANMTRQSLVDISNNSWGFGGFFGDNFKSFAFRPHRDALDDTVQNGRDGLGTVWVFAAGNSRGSGDNVNYHSFQNSRKTIAVAAAEDEGDHTFYSTPGAAVITTAPVAAGGGLGGVFSTDRTGSAGYAAGDVTSGFNGTSAATPMVSGVIALMLEANPDLGYRDVQEILAYSSRQNVPDDAAWAFNGAGDFNGGGLHVSHDFGFGLVDAHAAVRLAESWTKQSVTGNEQVVTAFRAPNLAIRDNATVSDSITITSAIDLQWVEIDVNIDHSYIGDLRLVLTSPDGTQSVLVDRPGKSANSTWGTSQDDINFVLTSARHWGESAEGTWTLSISDHFAADSGTLFNWRLSLFGDAADADDDHIFTDEYGRLAAGDASRRNLTDTGGQDRLNAAALTAAALIDLTPGATGRLAGQDLTLGATTRIEDAIGGDGADTLIGNDAANDLSGAGGDDSLQGGEGDDTLSGGRGADRFVYVAGDGNDRLTDFDPTQDILVLDGVSGILDLDSLIAAGRQNGGDFVIGLADGSQLTLANVTANQLLARSLELRNVPQPEPEPEPEAAGALSLGGGADNDSISGAEFDDLLWGRGGDDLIAGGDGGDTVLGEDGQDSLSGQAGDDRVAGGADDDTVSGGTGADTLTGDAGNDLVSGEGGADRLLGGTGLDTLHGGDGSDTLQGGTDNDLAHGDDGDDFVFGDAGGDSLFGGAGLDQLYGGDGADSLRGGLGQDIAVGGIGADTLVGDQGADSLFGGDADDTVYGQADDDLLRGDAGNDRMSGGEGQDTVLGGIGDDVMTGEAGDDTLEGADGADLIYGGDGSDTLTGDAGNDTLSGDAGTDTLDGGTGADSLLGGDDNDLLNGGSGQDTLRGGNGNDLLDGGDDSDTLMGEAGADSLQGEAGDDRLDGGNGNDSLSGGEGDDVLLGRAGNDLVFGATGADRLFGGEDADTLLGQGNNDILQGEAGDDRLSGGDGADSVFGGDGADLITGEIGDDRLGGDADNDRIFGGDGRDTLTGDGGNDTLDGDADNDLLDGGAGLDLLTGGAGADRLFGREDNDLIYGGTGDDSLDGGTGADTLQGGADADSLFGGDGADRLAGEAGDDQVFGGEGADVLTGDAGNDQLFGGSGADRLLGGSGGDTLTGGTDADRFEFAASDGIAVDRITDFEVGVDQLVLAGLTIDTIAPENVDGVAGSRLDLSDGSAIQLLGVTGVTADDLL